MGVGFSLRSMSLYEGTLRLRKSESRMGRTSETATGSRSRKLPSRYTGNVHDTTFSSVIILASFSGPPCRRRRRQEHCRRPYQRR
eukprot:09098_6